MRLSTKSAGTIEQKGVAQLLQIEEVQLKSTRRCGFSQSPLRLGRYQNFDFDPIPSTFKPSIESIEYRLSTQ